MKKLILMRHAKAGWSASSRTDLERTLDERGVREAQWMGEQFAAWRIVPDLLVSSPATRTLETASWISEKVGYPKDAIQVIEEIYEATGSDLVEVVRALEPSAKTVCLFGHHPGLQDAVSLLCSEHLPDYPTAGVAVMHFDLESFREVTRGSGQFERFVSPRGLR